MLRLESRPKLSRLHILEAALRLVDREGAEALSMRKLGAELGVEAMSLYRHVANKEAVLDGVVERLIEKLDVPTAGAQSWQEDIRRVADNYRHLARSHPRAFPLLALRPFTTPQSVDQERAILEIFRKAGFEEQAAHFAFRTFGSFTAGHLLEEVMLMPADTKELERWNASYEFGIHVLLTGLQAQLSSFTESGDLC